MPAFAEIAIIAATVAVVAALLRVCWTDFHDLKIWNRDLLVLAGLTAVYLLLSWPQDIALRLLLAAILFGLSFVFWLFRSLGAGDVKLFGIVGFLIPPEYALPFVVLILVFVLAIFLVYKKAAFLSYLPQIAGRRALKVAESGLIPYGVAISLAAIVVLIMTAAGGRA